MSATITQMIQDARCPCCGKPTDTFIGMTDDPAEVPVMLYCDLCNHQWINLANL